MSDKINIRGGLPLGFILAMIFMTLKLTGHITWSWWWVFVPMWGPAALILALLAGAGILLGVVLACKARGH